MLSDLRQSNCLLVVNFTWGNFSIPGIHGSANMTLQAFADTFPITLYSLRKQLTIKNSFVEYVVCPSCHKLYVKDKCTVKSASGVIVSLKCDHIEYPNHPQRYRRRKCGAELMKKVKIGRHYKFVPRKIYVYNSLLSSLERLIAKPNFLHQCEQWRKHSKNVPDGWLTDVYDGQLWKDWLLKGGRPFLDIPGNLLLMMNVDWFKPFEHSTYSAGVIYLVVQNLPRSLRFKLENIFIVGAIPGPHEPPLTINPYLEPMVDDLIRLWREVSMRTSGGLFMNKTVRAALGYVSCDIPATRKVCGFYGIKAIKGCSKCFKSFTPLTDAFGSSLDYSGFNRDSWEQRSHELHRRKAFLSNAAPTKKDREVIEHEIGGRYSEFLRLPYFDIVRCHLVDPMHNLLLGTAKSMMTIWKESGLLSNSSFENIQKQVDLVNLPAGIGRIPGKIATGFSDLTAEQWKTWTTVLSQYVLHDILPKEHYLLWCMFAQAHC